MTLPDPLPDGWRRARFGDVVRQVKEATKDAASLGLEHVVGLEHLDPGSLPVRRWRELADMPDGTSFTRVFRAGQVLFGKRRAYQRKVAVPDFDGICSGDILVFEPSTPDLLPEFLPYIVQSDGFFEHALGTSAGSLSPRTKWQELAKYEFTLPSMVEQKDLVQLLSAADCYLDDLDVAHSRATELLRSSMEKLLAEADAVPARPITVPTTVLLGRQLAPQYRRGERPIPYLRAANVVDGEVSWSDVNSMDFTEDDEVRYRVQVNDILMVEGGDSDTVGAPALVRAVPLESVCIQKSILRIRVNQAELTSPRYLYWYLRARFLNGDFERMASGTKLYHFTLNKRESIDVPDISLSAQQKRVDELESARNVIGRCRSVRQSVMDLRAAVLSQELGGGHVQ